MHESREQIDVHQNTRPPTYKEHARALRALILDATRGHEQPSPSTRLRDLMPPGSRADLVSLLRTIRAMARQGDADGLLHHMPREEPSIEAAMRQWREALRSDLAAMSSSHARGVRFDAAFDAAVAFLFDAIMDAHDMRALARNVDSLAPEKGFHRLGMEQRRRHIAMMTARLAERHQVSRGLVERVIAARHGVSPDTLSLAAVLDLYRKTWRTFGVGKDRRGLVKLTAIILVNRLLHNASPLLWTQIFDGKSFNAEYMALLGGLEIVDAHASKYETDTSTALLFVVRQRIHALAAKALFVRDLSLSDEYGTGELFDIIWKGEDAYNNIVRSLLADGVPVLLTIPIVLTALTVLHPMLGVLGLASIPMVYALARYAGPRMQLTREDGLTAKRALFTRGNTLIEGIETLLAQGHLAGGRRSFLALVREGDQIDRDQIHKWATIHVLQRYPVAISGIVTALFGAYLTSRGLIAPGGVITTVDYVGRLRNTVVEMIHRYFEQLPREINDARGLQRLLDWSDKVGGDEARKMRPSALPSTRLECRALDYRDIVRGLSLTIEPGEFVTISGTSGIGKTTLLRLIGGLYAPSAGSITIGGVPIKEIASEGPDSLFSLMAISSQSPYIFDDMTLRQNLILFNPDPDIAARVPVVLDQVGLEKLVPDLDAPGKRRLSGGERVRFGFARVLLKIRPDTPMIVLLDEPTSSLADDDGPGSMHAIRQLLKRVHVENPRLSFVCVTHDRALMAQAHRDIRISRRVVVRGPEPGAGHLAPPPAAVTSGSVTGSSA